MAFSGLKKQLNKANQFISEKVAGYEGTKLDDNYLAMEKRTDVTSGLVEDLQVKTKDFLQLNPSLFGGKSSDPVSALGECMTTYGRKLEDGECGKNLGRALEETGESLRKLADAKTTLDDSVKGNFLKPLNDVQTREIKDSEYHRDKVKSRRLDFDSKKNKLEQQQNAKSGTNRSSSLISEAEIKMAAGKFAESYSLAQLAMQKLVEKDLETVQNLFAFAESLHYYHSQCAQITKTLCETLEARKYEMENGAQAGRFFNPVTLKELDKYLDDNLPPYSPTMPDIPPARTPQRPPSLYSSNPPSCQALYDFVSEATNDLEFKAGDNIKLLRRVDANWFEGSLGGRTGYFPASYVHIIVPLP